MTSQLTPNVKDWTAIQLLHKGIDECSDLGVEDKELAQKAQRRYGKMGRFQSDDCILRSRPVWLVKIWRIIWMCADIVLRLLFSGSMEQKVQRGEKGNRSRRDAIVDEKWPMSLFVMLSLPIQNIVQFSGRQEEKNEKCQELGPLKSTNVFPRPFHFSLYFRVCFCWTPSLVLRSAC